MHRARYSLRAEAYVGLSRVRSLDRLRLRRPLTQRDILLSDDAAAYRSVLLPLKPRHLDLIASCDALVWLPNLQVAKYWPLSKADLAIRGRRWTLRGIAISLLFGAPAVCRDYGLRRQS